MKKFILIISILFLLLSLSIASAATLQFGSYPQTYETNGGKTPIEWIILDETDDAYLLLSKYALDANRFGSMLEPCYWHNSDIRTFLNGEFYNEAFAAEEQSRILTIRLYTARNRIYANNVSSYYSRDKVFLLSIEEFEQYLLNSPNAIAYATDFALIGHARLIGDGWGGVSVNSKRIACWWLRNNGVTEYYGAFINTKGAIVYDGEMVYAPHYAVRPAIWISKGDN